MNRPPDSRDGPRLSRPARIGILALGGLGLLCLLIGVARQRLHRQIEAELDALRSAGIAVTFEEAAARQPAAPPGPTASDGWRQAAEVPRPRTIADGAAVPSWSELLPAEALMNDVARERALAYLEAEAPFLRRVEQTLSITNTYWHLDLQQGTEMQFPEVQPVLRAARLKRLQAALACHDGRIDDAARHVESALGIGGQLNGARLAIHGLFGIAANAIALESLGEMLRIGTPSVPMLERLQGKLLASADSIHLREMFALELCLELAVFAQPGLDTVYFGPAGYWTALVPEIPWVPDSWNGRVAAIGGEMLVLVGFQQVDQLAYLRACADFLRMLEEPESTWWPNIKAWQARVDGLSNLRIATKEFPAWGIVRQSLRSRAYLRCAAAGMAVERYRLRHGSLPPDLSALVPDTMDAVPLDPFDGEPLRYRVDEGRYAIYSIGENETDDGGTIGADERWPLDYVFRLDPPEP